ncbi:hypothetical protein IQ247_31450 [Plectonema cf. radiosum LEGE 06105]|uniref:Uncharacterized protein n=1 Tax=Plectonema cf. radiosum LEGE 06105 TaxID=945769 RepID=A0A8J7FEA6_9CYAN|nr:hypothetical protein [Plectonema radiosum]MBE9217114.1 hypothetical protein [Plectonema cf. radiosum LEGE 06105]
MNANNNFDVSLSLPLHPPEDIDLEIFNSIQSPDYKQGKPIEDMKRLFHKQVIVDDQTTLDINTIEVPGFIGIADEEIITNSQGNKISGHEDIVQFLDQYGLLVCTYQYNKDRYGKEIDLRQSPQSASQVNDLMEIFIKNEGHHSGTIVPAIREGEKQAFASFNEPDSYHLGLYGENGFVAVAQNLVFPDFVTQEQQRGYTDSIICWMALMNPFVKFSQNDFNGGDPTKVIDRTSLQEFLKNCALASLGDESAIAFLNNSDNKAYCAEFVYISLNTPVYPFNLKGLTSLLNDEAKAREILAIQEKQNRRQKNILSDRSGNPEFQAFNIQMPVVPPDLPSLDVLMVENGINIDSQSIPFPAFTLSQVLRRAFRTLLPRHKEVNNPKIIEAQVKLFGYLEPLILKQLGLDNPYGEGFTPEATAQRDEKVKAVREFIAFIKSQLQQNYNNYTELDAVVDKIMEQADELIGVSDVKYFVPPRIYIDLGQNDGDGNLPQGWGFKLNTLGALIYRGAVKDMVVTPPQPTPEIPREIPETPDTPQTPPQNNPPRQKSQMR